MLIVEDDQSLAELIRIHLQNLGCETTCEDDGAEGVRRALEQSFDLVILDIMLPGMDGTEICRRVRAHRGSVPILMLTAKSDELDKVLSLEPGADDYMTKPFSIRELIAGVPAEAKSRAGSSCVPTTHTPEARIQRAWQT